MKVQCCVCKRVKEDGLWGNAMELPRREVSHTYCPKCLEDATAEMHAELLTVRRTELRFSRSY